LTTQAQEADAKAKAAATKEIADDAQRVSGQIVIAI
jgi:hypothetical protein